MMTVESLTNKLTEYVSWLYYGREWASWELLTVAMTALVLLLLIVRQRRKAKARKIITKQTKEHSREHSPTIGIKLDDSKKAPQEIDDSKTRLASVSKKDGKQKRWKETTKKWKNFRELVEKLQDEIAKYKQAEEQLKQQLTKLKAANEKLQHEIAESKQAVKLSDLGGPRTVASFGKQQNRMYDDRQLLVEDS